MAAEDQVKGEVRMAHPKLSDPELLSATSGAELESDDLSLSINKDVISVEQKKDTSLLCCRNAAFKLEEIENQPIGYFWDNEVLKRKWTLAGSDGLGWDTVFQLVVPKCFRKQVLSVAHDNVAGHLGITKTYSHILRYFFWPGIKSDVAQFCRSCHVCQVVGKPNQIIHPAPL